MVLSLPYGLVVTDVIFMITRKPVLMKTSIIRYINPASISVSIKVSGKVSYL